MIAGSDVRGYIYGALGLLGITGAAFVAGRYSAPTETILQSDVVTLTQVHRTVAIERVIDVKWKRRIEIKPDGSSVTEEEAVTHEASKTAENGEIQTSATNREVSKNTHAAQKWHLGLLAGVTGLNVQGNWNAVKPTFGVIVGRQLLGPIWVDVVVQSNSAISVGAAFQF